MGDDRGGVSTIFPDEPDPIEALLREAAHADSIALGQPRPEALAEAATAAVDGASFAGLRGTTAAAGLGPGAIVGRYVVLYPAGSGGMGDVYAAYDPALDRRIALKLLRRSPTRAGDDASAQARQLREAHALAKLAHPNVVAVHDVGKLGDVVFIAMEFVEGENLRQWQDAAPRTQGELLACYLAAGRGLEAAHAKGLFHRDFKPANVLVGSDGRVRVADFGLARHELREATGTPNTVATTEPEAAPSPQTHDVAPTGGSAPRAGGPLATPLTAVGSWIGTPGYMSPEQIRGEAADARSDQFSFCVALYEALYGARPFAGAFPRPMVEHMLRNELLPAPKGSRVGPALRRVLERGLRASPAQRYPDMTALLAELSRDPARRRRRAGLGLAGVMLLGVGVASALAFSGRAPVCHGADQKLRGVWDDERAVLLRAAFTATGLPFAVAAASGVVTVMDAYARRWVAAHQDACEATFVRGEQSDELLDRRMACLSVRQRALGALARVFEGADAAVVEKAARAATLLPAVAECADVAALVAQVRPPTDPDVRVEVEARREVLAQATALQLAGKYADGLRIASAVVQQARELGYRPLLAEALFREGELLGASAQPVKASVALGEAAFAAQAERHDELYAKVTTRLACVSGAKEVKKELGDHWAKHAAAAVHRIGAPAEARAQLKSCQGQIAFEHGKYEESRHFHEESLALLERLFGPGHSSVAEARNELSNLFRHMGRFEDALSHEEQALQIWRTVHGEKHPIVGRALTGLGSLMSSMGRYAKAADYHRAALALWEEGRNELQVAVAHNNLANVLNLQGQTAQALTEHRLALAARLRQLGPTHPAVAASHNNIGKVQQDLGELQAALSSHQQAFAIWEKALGAKHPNLATSLVNQGDALKALGRYPEAIAVISRAKTIWEAALGADHPNLATVHSYLGAVYEKLGDKPGALSHLQRSLEICEKKIGAEHPFTALVVGALGLHYLGRGDETKARAYLERAVKVAQGSDGDPAAFAKLRFSLARLLWRDAREQARALALASAAETELEKPGVSKQPPALLREIAAWRSTHALPPWPAIPPPR